MKVAYEFPGRKKKSKSIHSTMVKIIGKFYSNALQE